MKDDGFIQLAHGGGGQLTSQLLAEVILPALASRNTATLTDSAMLDMPAGPVAFTTDSFVVQPLEFPGGDIGKLAVCGTANDLAVCGARPKWLSLGLVLDEGFPIALLKRIVNSIGQTARQIGAAVVTGDTKVVERGGAAGMVINTAGLGVVHPKAKLGFENIRESDSIIVSGPLGQHAIAVLGARKNLGLTCGVASDCSPVVAPAMAIIEELGPEVRFMRDPTRGGLAATLVELSTACGRDVEVRQADIPLDRTTNAAAEILGLDLLSAANEGKLVAVVDSAAAGRAIKILHRIEIASQAAIVGVMGSRSAQPLVELVTELGSRRIVQMPYGEDLPRIC